MRRGRLAVSDRAIGIALGILLGVAIIIAFLILGSRSTIDAPSLSDGSSQTQTQTQPPPVPSGAKKQGE